MQTFKIIYPSPALKPFVRYYWVLQDSSPGMVSQRTLPTGCMSLVFHRGERLKVVSQNDLQPRCFISGQETSFTDVISTGNIEMIVTVFQPHTAKMFFHIPVSLFCNRNISIYDMEDIELQDLAGKMGDADNLEKAVTLIENFLLNRALLGNSYNIPRLSNVVRHISNSVQTNIKGLADIACLSEKQFCRIFSEHIGTTPKDFLRIIRLQRTLSILQHNPKIGFAQLSYECGYTDQSHMIKEFRLFTGYTPKEYISRCAPVSDYFTF